MHHASMASVAGDLSQQGIATLRYQFPYMEQGSRRPDVPAVAHAAVRAAVAEAARRLPDTVLIAGGKSFGGRMTSQAQATQPLPGARGLAFLGFPLHPPKQPSDDRARHLFDVRIPMLFTWVGFFVVRIPLAYLLTGERIDLGLLGAWLAMFADLQIRGLFVLVRFASGRWRGIRV